MSINLNILLPLFSRLLSKNEKIAAQFLLWTKKWALSNPKSQ